MSTWLTLILALIKYGPEIYQLIKEILDLIGKLRGRKTTSSLGQSKEFEAELSDAVSHYRRHRKITKLVELRDRLKAELKSTP